MRQISRRTEPDAHAAPCCHRDNRRKAGKSLFERAQRFAVQKCLALIESRSEDWIHVNNNFCMDNNWQQIFRMGHRMTWSGQ
jgi:hypothetical protein